MLIRFINFLFHTFLITLLPTEKSSSNMQTKIPLLNFSPSPNINKRFTCMRSISADGSSHRRCSVKTNIGKFQGQTWDRCFSVNFAKFLRTPFLQDISGECFWFRTSSVDFNGSNQEITVLIDVAHTQSVGKSISQQC